MVPQMQADDLEPREDAPTGVDQSCDDHRWLVYVESAMVEQKCQQQSLA